MIEILRAVTADEINKLNEVNKNILKDDEKFMANSCAIVKYNDKQCLYTENSKTGTRFFIDLNNFDLRKAEIVIPLPRRIMEICWLLLFLAFAVASTILTVVAFSYLISVYVLGATVLTGTGIFLGVLLSGLCLWFINEYRDYVFYKASFMARVTGKKRDE